LHVQKRVIFEVHVPSVPAIGASDGEEVRRQLPEWIEHYNRQAPHSALGMRSLAGFYEEWMVKNETQSVQN